MPAPDQTVAETPTPRMDKLREKFLARVSIGPSCWEWTGDKREHGYGCLYWNRRRIPAHRVSYELYKGPIPAGLLICHKCDNPSCVRPDHLFAGTYKDNAMDASAKGRLWQNNPKNKQRLADSAEAMRRRRQVLNESIARAVFVSAKNGRRTSEIAKEFGIRRSMVSDIKARRKWSNATKDL